MTLIAQTALAPVGSDYHNLAMPVRPICEPVELPPGTSFIAERVSIKANARDVGDFVHFHDVAELVLFKRVRGSFIADGKRLRVGEGSVVFIPSMSHHDFALESCPMEWVLIQFDPDFMEEIGVAAASFRTSFCASPVGVARARIDLLADWIVEAVGRSEAKVERIAQLLLLAIADIKPETADAKSDAAPLERLLPALDMLRRAPEQPIALQSAATSCRVSPAYFSRRFRQLFGMTFTQYARTYRLRLAARRLTASPAPISEIAYSVGFPNPAHFTARFRERFGMTPRQYRASARLRSAG